MSPDPNRQRPRSSKKHRTVQGGARSAVRVAGPAESPNGNGGRPPTQRVSGGRPRARTNSRQGGTGSPTAWLIGIAIVVVAVGAGFLSGAIRLGGGGAATSSGGTAGGIAGCPTAQPAPASAGTTSVVTIDTSLGVIELALKADLSPIAVGNFVTLARCGYYDGVVFHRVVPGFVIQAGDGQFGRATAFNAARVGSGGPGYDLTDEPVTASYQRGTVAMARGRGPNSAGSQFFIVLDDGAASSLTGGNYQIIGSATKGMEIVDAIAAAADAEIPSEPVTMTKLAVTP